MKSKKVFLASDVIYAFIDRGHPKHVHASAFFRYFAQEQYLVFTSIQEIHSVSSDLAKNISPTLAKDFIRALSLSNINILFPEESDLKAIYKTLLSSSSVDLNFSHALTAVLANKRAIPQICTFEYLHSLFGLTAFYLPI